MNRIDGKIAVVTGGTQGLGAAVALELARSGAAGIVTCGRSARKGADVAAAVSSETNCPVHFVKADLSVVADCRNVVAECDKQFGHVDILVNAAGMTDRGNILSTDEALFDKMFAVNARAPYFLMQETISRMIRDSVEGAIVNIGSTSAQAGQPFISAYCASKGALSTMTRNTAFSVMRNRIRVNQLNIGWMASEGEDRIQREYHGAAQGWLEEAAAKLPFARLLAPEEVAKAVVFLASADSGMMTGSVINFDQSVWAGYEGGPPLPTAPLSL